MNTELCGFTFHHPSTEKAYDKRKILIGKMINNTNQLKSVFYFYF